MIDDLLAKLPVDYLVTAKSLLKSLSVKSVSELVNAYPVVRANFIGLLDSGVISDYLSSNSLSFSRFPNSVKLVELLRELPVVDDCDPSSVYSLLVISSQLRGGCLDLFYHLGVDGSNTEDAGKQLFYPLIKPLISAKRLSLSDDVKSKVDYLFDNFNHFNEGGLF